MSDYTKWERTNFSEHPKELSSRELAESETNRDLQKAIQQLICDVHEECLNPLPEKVKDESDQHWNERLAVLQLQRLVGGQKRMVSLMGRVALEHERTSKRLVYLTVAIIVLTIVLLFKS